MNDLKIIAEKKLSAVWKRNINLSFDEKFDSSNRSNVCRFTVNNSLKNQANTVIVKKAIAVDQEVYDPNSNSGPAVRFFNDLAGISFLKNKVSKKIHLPDILCYSSNSGVVVLSDLNPVCQVDDLLMGQDYKVAKDALMKLMTVLAEIHFSTIGKKSEYISSRDSYGPSLNHVEDVRNLIYKFDIFKNKSKGSVSIEN